ncbi:MAG: prepilin-type N-terminal cleavage/methylation domain-containing protein [Planctomycetota bacterium]|nr:prepilin-type N-terminal cleavage/methylation domain-containing protein [Planctomycetota bacterium]
MSHPKGRAAGFTLIEMLAVILILGILTTFLLTTMFGARETANEKLTETRIANIAAAIGNFEGVTGDYPSSSQDDGLAGSGSAFNTGIEALVKAMWSEPHDGFGLDDDFLFNTDGDQASGQPLFELVDMWENPLAYFHRSDYGQKHVYLTIDEAGNEVENQVEARKHPRTGRWANRKTFQLLSAGSDGIFGTSDDLANFDIQE